MGSRSIALLSEFSFSNDSAKGSRSVELYDNFKSLGFKTKLFGYNNSGNIVSNPDFFILKYSKSNFLQNFVFLNILTKECVKYVHS